MFLDYGGKMRKFKYLLATGLISAALLVGCGSESDKKDSAKDLTPKEFFEEIQNSAQKDVKSAEYEMSAKIDVEGANEDSSISGDAKIKGDFDIDSGSVHMNISGSLMEKFLQQSSIDGYLTIEDTEGTVYLSMDNGPWAKKSVDVSDYINQISNLIMETPADGNTDFDADEALKFLKDTKVKSDDDGYTFTGTMDIDKIISKSSRKRVLSFELQTVSRIEKFNPSQIASINSKEVVIACDTNDPDAYLMVSSAEGKGSIYLVFAPDERVRGAIVKFVPKFIANSAFK